MEEKYIGLALAICSSLAIGSSYVITKTGLKRASEQLGFTGDGLEYLWSPWWWVGTTMFVSGEFMNTAAYAFAPAILVTPLGALSVLIGAIMGAYFLNEHLGLLGKLGASTCLLGSVMLILHAPPDKDIQTVDEILHLAIQPFFLCYTVFVVVSSTCLIYRVVPRWGKVNPVIYISICSTVGSISVMAVKALGIAVKLTLAGNNQFNRPATYFFMIVVGVSIMTQMNYLNKAMHQFPTSLVNALYYVTFTTCTLSASFILFQGFNTADLSNTLSLLSGFVLNFMGVYLLMMVKSDFNDRENHHEAGRVFERQSNSFAESVLSLSSGLVHGSTHTAERPSEQAQESLLRSYRESTDGIELENYSEGHQAPKPKAHRRSGTLGRIPSPK